VSDLNPVRGPFKRIRLEPELIDPNAPPARPGPLVHVRRPFQRIRLEPDTSPSLRLSVAADADADAILSRVVGMLAELDRFARASGGSGLSVDVAHSTATAGLVVLRLVPADPARGAEQAEVLRQHLRQLPGVTDVTVSTAA
jgi:hypothetical protein